MKSEKRKCVRCWVNLREGEKLRCRVCIDRVNEELEGKADRNYEYYFKFYIKKAKKDERILWERLKNILKV